MFIALFLSNEASAFGSFLMMIPIVVISVGLVLAPLFIWSWCKHTAKAVEANTAELKALHNTLRRMAPQTPPHVTIKRP